MIVASTPEPMGRLVGNTLDLIGKTPLVCLGRISPKGGAKIWGKCEFMNPGGSVKDRPALWMIKQAKATGELKDGATIVEATSGNTGISLALIASLLGHRCILVMPEDMSMERRLILKAHGAEIELSKAERGMAGAVEEARALVRKNKNAFMPSQFENEANPLSHQESTGPEIIEQLAGKVDAFVAGVGTGGTITGVARALKLDARTLDTKVIAVEPAASPVLSGGRPAMHGIQGLGAGFVPKILERDLLDEILTVSDVAAEKAQRLVAAKEGLMIGPSAGANFHAAYQVASEMSAGNVVTILCDSGERYLF